MTFALPRTKKDTYGPSRNHHSLSTIETLDSTEVILSDRAQEPPILSSRHTRSSQPASDRSKHGPTSLPSTMLHFLLAHTTGSTSASVVPSMSIRSTDISFDGRQIDFSNKLTTRDVHLTLHLAATIRKLYDSDIPGSSNRNRMVWLSESYQQQQQQQRYQQQQNPSRSIQRYS